MTNGYCGTPVAITKSIHRMSSTFVLGKKRIDRRYWVEEPSESSVGPLESDKQLWSDQDLFRPENRPYPSTDIEHQLRHPRLAIKVDKMTLLLDANEVVVILAQGNYVRVMTVSDSRIVRESISVTAGKLKDMGFVRISRSIIVNRSHVQEIRPSNQGEYTLRMSGGREFAVTRRYQENIRDLAAFWMGMRAHSTDMTKATEMVR